MADWNRGLLARNRDSLFKVNEIQQSASESKLNQLIADQIISIKNYGKE